MALRRPGLLTALILVFLALVFLALLFPTRGFAQNSDSGGVFTISVAKPTAAKDVQVRYFFTGEFGGRGSSTSDPVDGNKIVIKTGVDGQSAKTFKLIAYAPGCQLVTLAVDDLASSNRQGQFQCQPLPTVQLHGRLDILDFNQKNLQVQAFYDCRWAMPFFGIADGSISPVTLGKAAVASDGTFTLELPDFTADPTWPRISGDAGFRFFLADGSTGKPLATLNSLSDLTHEGGVVPVAPSYPEISFAVQK